MVPLKLYRRRMLTLRQTRQVHCNSQKIFRRSRGGCGITGYCFRFELSNELCVCILSVYGNRGHLCCLLRRSSLKKCRRSCGGCGVPGLNCAIHSVRVWLSLFLCCLRCDLHADNCYVTVKATRNVQQPCSSLKMDGIPGSSQCGGITGSPSVESHVFRFRR
jgi:hypothetical protein